MMIGIASLTVIVAIGDGIKIKVLSRIANMGFGPESFSVIAGAGKMFFSRSKNTTSMSLEDAEDLLRGLTELRLTLRSNSLSEVSDQELENGNLDLELMDSSLRMSVFAYIVTAEVQERLIDFIA